MEAVTKSGQRKRPSIKTITQILADHRSKKSLLNGSNISELTMVYGKSHTDSPSQIRADLDNSIFLTDNKAADSKLRVCQPHYYFSLGVKSIAKGLQNISNSANINFFHTKKASGGLLSIVQPPKLKDKNNLSLNTGVLASQIMHKKIFGPRESQTRNWLTRKASRFEQETTLKSSEIPDQYPNLTLENEKDLRFLYKEPQFADQNDPNTSQNPNLLISQQVSLGNNYSEAIRPNSNSPTPISPRPFQDEVERLRKQYEKMLNYNQELDLTANNLKQIGLRKGVNFILKKIPTVKKSISVHLGGEKRRSVRFADEQEFLSNQQRRVPSKLPVRKKSPPPFNDNSKKYKYCCF